MNANIMKTQSFHLIKYDLRGHWRSQKVTLKIKNYLFLRYISWLTPNLWKPLKGCQHYEDTYFLKWSMTSKVIKGHVRPLLCQNPSSTFVYGPILLKIYLNVNIMKTQFFIKSYITWNVTLKLWITFVFFCFEPFWPNYNLDLRSYGQLVSLSYIIFLFNITNYPKLTKIRV